VMPSPISTEGIIGIAIAVVVIISCFITCIIIVIIIIVIWIKKSKACTGSKRGKYDVTATTHDVLQRYIHETLIIIIILLLW
jgi:hypothetical protein